MSERDFERSIFWPDTHAPYQDETAVATALAFVRRFKPAHVFLLGDLVDFYPLSRFDKDPARQQTLQAELDATASILAKIRKAAPRAAIVYLEGNHERRLRRYLWRKASELSSLRALTLPDLLGLASQRIEYVEAGCRVFNRFLVKHGNLVRSRSGYSATGEMEKAGCSGISGHTHRLGQVYKTNYVGDMFTWVESGCLCDLNPEYMEGQTVDWQHGLAYGHYESSGSASRYVVHTTPIIKGAIVYGGTEITA